MPSVYGNIQIFQATGGVVHFGDALTVSPKSALKEVYGSGAHNYGAFVVANAAASSSNLINPDVADQTVAGNM